MFVDPSTGSVSVNAPRLLVTPDEGDFQLHARVEVAFGSTFDAGVLLLWVDERTWAKLCFEYSPQGNPMVVTVVTRGLSDDANGYTVDGNVVWLRVARRTGAYAFHASTRRIAVGLRAPLQPRRRPTRGRLRGPVADRRRASPRRSPPSPTAPTHWPTCATAPDPPR